MAETITLRCGDLISFTARLSDDTDTKTMIN